MSTLLSSKHDCTIHFVYELHRRYSCGICYQVADEPLGCGNLDGCTGIFCMQCLTTSLSRKKECPLCNFFIEKSPQKNNTIKEIIADEIIYCSLALLQDEYPSKKGTNQLMSRSDCQWTGPFNALDAHLAHNCSFAPVPCTNHGCKLTPIRSQLSHHLANNCLFRTIPCPHCASPLRVGNQAEHLGICDKVSLTCTDCHASYLREDQTAHDLACLEKSIPCPFARYGCSSTILRKDADQHEIDSTVYHAKLLGVELNRVNKQLIKVNTTLSDHTSINERLTFELNELRQSYKATETIHVGLIADLKAELSALKTAVLPQTATSTTATNLQRGTATLFIWIIDKVTERINSSDTVNSTDFSCTIGNYQGKSVLYFQCSFKTDKQIEICLFKDINKSTNKEQLCADGTEILLCHPTDITQRYIRTCSRDSILVAPEWGVCFATYITDITPFICSDGSIKFECYVRFV